MLRAFLASGAQMAFRIATRRSRLLAVVAVAVGLVPALAVVNPASAPAAASRHAQVATKVSSESGLLVAGSVNARRRDVFVLYLARRCVSTLRAARAGHYVIASGRVGRAGTDEFRATIASSEVKPKRGRACYLLADSRRRTKTQASSAYRMG